MKKKKRQDIENDGDRKVIKGETINEGIGREPEKKHAV